ncbi:aminoacyl-tRNA hydrolase [Actinomycetaceae bacterium WB03_NA08]|uniref:Peptidyl-tRNA hydrolase n=1 Tax=Scrofimicrobium canadense TaxID=2652290 RepID=A0A6N7VTK6_9ACTO|nr:aminoacyl-tRNA hydrolase [Scrofimicrobium canadense]MSS85099.1 aminoacyl-tRNA hydrolase [Scrofimicrobium canadense]
MTLKLVIGLGNPGTQYVDTRHNVGAATIAVLVKRLGATMRSHTSRCHVAEARIGILPGGAPGPKITLAVADSYMNVSGGPLSRLAQYLRISPDEILVIHDDLDLPAHQLRLKQGGGEGGHNGLRSLSQHLGDRNYGRLRIGIGRPPGRQNPADFVLEKISSAAREEWNVTYELAADTVEDVAVRGFAAAQQDLHSRS